MHNTPTLFTRLSKGTSRVAGRPLTFALVVILVVAWAVSGPLFDYSDTWQLTINTLTTIVTFLMVFLIQATQNRDAEAIQIKLDELLRAQQGAHNALLDLEELEEDDLRRLRANYLRLAEEARRHIEKGEGDTDVPDIDEPQQGAVQDIKGGPRRGARRRFGRPSASTHRKSARRAQPLLRAPRRCEAPSKARAARRESHRPGRARYVRRSAARSGT
jgi:low affinity Fe/Cu permease